METLLLLLLFPLAYPFVAKWLWHHTINWTEMLMQIGLVSLMVTGVWYAGVYSQTSDTEIWNGMIVGKDREHGWYQVPYECEPCFESCTGSDSTRSCTRTCSTCYEDHYTVTWTADTTVGDVTFAHLDSTWRSVYNTPDPDVYTRCIPGEPASLEHTYINYVQAVPGSLYRVATAQDQQYVDLVPTYPGVFDFYRIQRVLNVDSTIAQTAQKLLNSKLNESLRTLGSAKQVNVVVILTEIDDPNFRYTVETIWQGGEKNDVVVFLGFDGNAITWTDVMTWALNKDNELLHVTLRDALMDLKVYDTEAVHQIITSHITQLFDRPEMADFQYLDGAIEPPTWVIISLVIIAIGGSIGLGYVFHRCEIDDVVGSLFNKRRR